MSITIDKIVFENFRQYGTGTLRFENTENGKLSILIAKNGTGKTTLLNSITWCLYEKEQQLVDKNSTLAVVSTEELKKAEIGTIIPVSVAVTIIDNDKVIEFKRSQNYRRIDKPGSVKGVADATKFAVSTTVNGRFENTKIDSGTDADLIVRKYFDYEIFDFYFFDGEKLTEFFATDRTSHIKTSIYNIAQVTLLQNAYAHINDLRKRKTRELGKNNPNIKELIDEQDRLKEQRALAETTIESHRTEKQKLVLKRDSIDEVLRGHAPITKLQDERQQLETELKRIEQNKKVLENDRSGFIRKYIVLIKLYPRITKTLQMISSKETSGDLPPAIDKAQIIKVLEHLDEPCPLCANPHIGEIGRLHLENLLEEISVSSKTSNYLKEIKGSLEDAIEEVHKYQAQKDSLNQREIDLNANAKKVEDRLREINAILVNYNSADGKLNVSEVERDRNNILSRISTADEAIGAASKTLEMCNKQIDEFETKIDDARKKLNIKKELNQQIEILDKIENFYQDIKDHITDHMRKEIQATTWAIFDSMIWKRNTFGKIEIGEEYDVSVYNKEENIMTGSLSATEKMALAYAFTLAIHEASGKNCPLVIDSPLGRVSDENRINMAKALLEISKKKQIIMLFTPDEYSSSVMNLYKEDAEIRTLQLTADEKYIEGIER